jgi:hypothetical protein
VIKYDSSDLSELGFASLFMDLQTGLSIYMYDTQWAVKEGRKDRLCITVECNRINGCYST